MNLSDLLKSHLNHQTRGSLKKNLGDGYLLKHNPIYRNIRRAAVKHGARFTAQRLHDYDALPLTQLPFILKTRQLPYLDNVRPLLEIEKIAPKAFRWNEVPPLKSNTLLHEAAHLVARSIRLKTVGKLEKPSSPGETQKLILGSMIEEAFANTIECLANIYVNDEYHDEFLFKNSYIMEKPKDRKTLKSAESSLGSESLFRLLFQSYLHANFLRLKWDDSTVKRVVRFSKLKTVKNAQLVQGVIRIGLNLDPAFTQFTGSFCFRLMGIEGNIYEFLDFDFLEILEKNSQYEKWICELYKLLINETR